MTDDEPDVRLRLDDLDGAMNAVRMLESAQNDVGSVVVDVWWSAPTRPAESDGGPSTSEQPTLSDVTTGPAGEAYESRTARVGRPGLTPLTDWQNARADDDVAVEISPVRVGSVQHELLQLIHDGEPVVSRALEDRIEDHSRNSVTGGLRRLYQKLLVERRKVSDQSAMYQYRLTDYGHDELDDLGEFGSVELGGHSDFEPTEGAGTHDVLRTLRRMDEWATAHEIWAEMETDLLQKDSTSSACSELWSGGYLKRRNDATDGGTRYAYQLNDAGREWLAEVEG